MGLVQRLDRKLESTVGDAFARVFGGSVVPEEVEGMLRREAADGVRSLQGGRLLAPNEYVITLSVSDHAKVLADPDITSDTFAKHLGGYIGEQGWQTYGDVVVRFEQSPSLHTGQVRARGVVNPDATVGGAAMSAPAAPQSDRASNAEPGVPPMSDNPSYRGGPGQGRPGDEYYDDRYGRPEDAQDPRAGYAPQAPQPPQGPEQGGYPPQGDPNYPPRQGGYPDQGGYAPSYEQRPPAGYGGPPSGGYDQGYRQQPYGPPSGGYGEPPRGDYNYGRPPGPDYGRPPGPPEGRPDPRGGYPDQGGYDQGYQGGPGYGRPDYGQPDYGRGYEGGGYGEPPRGDYDYGQPPAQGGYADYGQPAPGGDYPGAAGATVTLQLDDGSGRTYQLREGANVVGRGQDAQFRLPDTGVSRRHLEIRWDGQVALLSDLNSTNGTTVNNAPVQEWQLADGDVIRLGHSEIVVRVH
ncbi:DUF3662 and FHA domain-containing protein [[Mycobacterium] wendilense]|uniref:DUF3662 and FHA domain-containing protein n=1 Tax=[Mycobacterium] wendilense TaxID=3064284 RepID=A0ABM9M7W6_9MYCO|nr:DUF3662 and FHA domain-containing protein [Mycolicibacterium sp. MU0050]CAJ1578326.1 DUF3662 and FHA domain-containing protein [Mycolicibacterium sp. MU0050]